LQRQHLRATYHRVVAHLDDTARFQITRQESHDLRAGFIGYPRDDAVQGDVVEQGEFDLPLRQIAEAVLQQGEIRQAGFVAYRRSPEYVQRVEIARVEVAVRMRRRKNQGRQALAESELAIGEFFEGRRRYALHRKAGIQESRTLFVIVAGRVGNRIVVAGRPGHGVSSFHVGYLRVRPLGGIYPTAPNYADNATIHE
jgi:uncharacterized protein (UPF0305 family)